MRPLNLIKKTICIFLSIFMLSGVLTTNKVNINAQDNLPQWDNSVPLEFNFYKSMDDTEPESTSFSPGNYLFDNDSFLFMEYQEDESVLPDVDCFSYKINMAFSNYDVTNIVLQSVGFGFVRYDINYGSNEYEGLIRYKDVIKRGNKLFIYDIRDLIYYLLSNSIKDLFGTNNNELIRNLFENLSSLDVGLYPRNSLETEINLYDLTYSGDLNTSHHTIVHANEYDEVITLDTIPSSVDTGRFENYKFIGFINSTVNESFPYDLITFEVTSSNEIEYELVNSNNEELYQMGTINFPITINRGIETSYQELEEILIRMFILIMQDQAPEEAEIDDKTYINMFLQIFPYINSIEINFIPYTSGTQLEIFNYNIDTGLFSPLTSVQTPFIFTIYEKAVSNFYKENGVEPYSSIISSEAYESFVEFVPNIAAKCEINLTSADIDNMLDEASASVGCAKANLDFSDFFEWFNEKYLDNYNVTIEKIDQMLYGGNVFDANRENYASLYYIKDATIIYENNGNRKIASLSKLRDYAFDKYKQGLQLDDDQYSIVKCDENSIVIGYTGGEKDYLYTHSIDKAIIEDIVEALYDSFYNEYFDDDVFNEISNDDVACINEFINHIVYEDFQIAPISFSKDGLNFTNIIGYYLNDCHSPLAVFPSLYDSLRAQKTFNKNNMFYYDRPLSIDLIIENNDFGINSKNINDINRLISSYYFDSPHLDKMIYFNIRADLMEEIVGIEELGSKIVNIDCSGIDALKDFDVFVSTSISTTEIYYDAGKQVWETNIDGLTCKEICFEDSSENMHTLESGEEICGTLRLNDVCADSIAVTEGSNSSLFTNSRIEINSGIFGKESLDKAIISRKWLENNTCINVCINGGDFVVPKKGIIEEYAIIVDSVENRQLLLEINDGRFNLTNGSLVDLSDGKELSDYKIEITGGKFGTSDSNVDLNDVKAQLEELIPEGYTVCENTDNDRNTYQFIVNTPAVTIIKADETEKQYSSISSALEDAEEGDVIIMNEDANVNGSVLIDDEVTLDLKGNNLSASKNITVFGTIIDSSIEDKGKVSATKHFIYPGEYLRNDYASIYAPAYNAQDSAYQLYETKVGIQNFEEETGEYATNKRQAAIATNISDNQKEILSNGDMRLGLHIYNIVKSDGSPETHYFDFVFSNSTIANYIEAVEKAEKGVTPVVKLTWSGIGYINSFDVNGFITSRNTDFRYSGKSKLVDVSKEISLGE